MHGRAVLTAMLVAAGAPPAVAQAQDGARSVAAMVECRGVADDGERLRCFDKAVGRVAAARSSGELVTLDRSKVVATKRQGFGLPTPRERAAPAEGLTALEPMRQLDSTIVEVRPAEYGRFLVALADRSVWKTAEPMQFAPSRGASIRIVRANFGAFRATVGKGRPFLIKRVR